MIHSNRLQLMTFILTLLLIIIFPGQGSANSIQIKSHGQTVYVPIYSHIYHGNKERTFNLTATLSIRNTNLTKDIILHSIDYFDSNGNLLKEYLTAPIVLKKFSTIRYVIHSG